MVNIEANIINLQNRVEEMAFLLIIPKSAITLGTVWSLLRANSRPGLVAWSSEAVLALVLIRLISRGLFRF